MQDNSVIDTDCLVEIPFRNNENIIAHGVSEGDRKVQTPPASFNGTACTGCHIHSGTDLLSACVRNRSGNVGNQSHSVPSKRRCNDET